MNRRHLLRFATAVVLQSHAIDRVRAATSAAGTRTPEEIAADEDFWSEIRAAFSVDRNIINFNNGYVSPSPRPVQDAMRRYLEYTDMGPYHTMVSVLEQPGGNACAAAWRRPRAATPRRWPSRATPAKPWRTRSTASTCSAATKS